MFAPAMAPGQALSVSDYLWTATPWESTRPADVPPLGSNREQTDSVTMFQPFLQHTRAALPDIPLWNPYAMGGRPFHGNSQSATVSPFSFPAYVLPFWDSLAVMAALKLFVAAFGTFLLGRLFGMRFGGALLAGLVFGFSLWCVTWVSWTTMGVWAYLPWLCLLAELCVRRPGPLPFAGLSAVVGFQFLGGHPSSSFQIMVAVAAFWGVRALVAGGGSRAARLLTLGAAFVTGTALAAITLIPFVELLSHSIDVKARSAAAEDAHEPARYLLGIFLHDWWGRGSRAPTEFASALEEHAYYVAALPLMLAAAALVLAPRRQRVVVAVVGGVALAVATGIPPFFDVISALPGFDAARNGRVAVIPVLCVAVLAGWGLDDLAARPLARRRAVLAVCAGLFALPVVLAVGRIDIGALPDALGYAWGFVSPEPGAVAEIRLSALLEWLVVGAAALALVALRLSGRLRTTAFVAAAIALVALDLFKAGMGYNPAIDEADAVQPVTPAVAYLQEQWPARFAGLHPEAPITLAVPIPPNVAMRYGLADARGYDFPFEERYAELWRRVIAKSPDCNYAFCPESAGRTPQALQALGLLGVTDLLQHRADPPLTDLEPAYEGPDARVYRNPRALPRAFLVGGQAVVESADAARELATDPSFPVRTTAVVEEPVDGLADEDGEAGDARISDYEDERVVVQAQADRPALLVLTDTWFPGWKATVDGEPAEVERVDYLIRGVPVPAGAHTVVFTYEPLSFRAGWIVSLLALLVILAAAGIGWRRRGASRP
jgi:hypothetical protein